MINRSRKSDKMKIPINKGNYSLDTPEREEAFHRCISADWEEKYKKYRRDWIEYPEKQYVAEYPTLVDLELSTICNLKCPMCYTITDSFKEKVGSRFMDFSLFKKIIDEIGGKVPTVRLSLRGEATIHPNFIEAIKYAKDKGINEVSTLTNGSKLTKGFFEKMMHAGIDWVTVSVDGIEQTYENIRRPLKFKDILKKIKDIKSIKDENNRAKPVIKIQTVWPAIKEDPEKFYNTFVSYVDLIAFNPLIDYLGKDENVIFEEGFACPQHYQRLVIGSDGLAMMCSNDEDGSVIIGDADKEKIYDIWHGKKLNSIRDAHRRKNGFMDIPACRKCYLPRLTEEKESFNINGREIIIKNYTNRKQVIGE